MLEQVIMYEAPKNPPPSPKQSAGNISNQDIIPSPEHENTHPETFLKEQLELLEIHYGLTKCEVFDYEMTGN